MKVSRPETLDQLAAEVSKAAGTLNAARFGSMVLPVVGIAAAAAAGPVSIWVAGAMSAMVLATVSVLSKRWSKALTESIGQLRESGAIPVADADRLDRLAKSIRTGSQPVSEAAH